VFVYDHLDVDHLRWGIAKAEGRAALIVTHSVFPLDGDIAPLPQIVELAQRRRLRLMVDEGHGIGILGDGGRGALARFDLEDQVDVIVGTLGHALGSYGGFVACHREMADYLLNASRTLQFSSAPSPPAAAAALAALTLLDGRPQLVSKLGANAAVVREELERHGFYFDPIPTAILSIPVGDPGLANRVCDRTLKHGVLIEAVSPPIVPAIKSRLRLTVVASHRREELTDAAATVADACLAAGFDPGEAFITDEIEDPAFDPRPTELFDVAQPAPGIFDVERLAA
jgi:glycine C-acetyltransferase/8-amino-7-oxononanoate synthase